MSQESSKDSTGPKSLSQHYVFVGMLVFIGHLISSPTFNAATEIVYSTN